jgi:hypothetical protein
MKTIVTVTLCLASLWAFDAQAAEEDPADPGHEPLDKEEGISDWDHFEFSMGFLGGGRHYEHTNFEYEEGGGDIAGARTLAQPFLAKPFDNLYVAGLRYDVRLVVSYVRMTAGVDVPFPIYNRSTAIGMYDVGGVSRAVAVQGITPVDLRFGIGGEYPIGPVAPFVDLLGGVHWTHVELTLDDTPVDYAATSFGLSLRAGARVHVRKWFFAAAAGEVGLVGDVRWGAELSVGFAAM